MKFYSIKLLSFLLVVSIWNSFAQERKLVLDTIVKTNHSVTVNGTTFNYTAQTGTQPVWDEMGKPIASLHYTYYARDGVRDRASRPLLISFNGGPGSGSVWMHLAYTGPRVLNIDDEGYPVQPYGVRQNPYSVLDTSSNGWSFGNVRPSSQRRASGIGGMSVERRAGLKRKDVSPCPYKVPRIAEPYPTGRISTCPD